VLPYLYLLLVLAAKLVIILQSGKELAGFQPKRKKIKSISSYDEYKNSVFHSKDETCASIVHIFSLSLQKNPEIWQRIC